MGCCLSKKPSSIPHSSGTSCDVKSPDPFKPDVNKPTKPVTELPVKAVIALRENPAVEEESKPTISEEKVQKEEENATSKDASVIEHMRNHERSMKTESEESPDSVAVEKPFESVVRTSSCTKEEVDAILIQCGKLSRSNSAAKTRRYSGSKRSFDLEEEEAAGRKTPQRNRQRGVERVNGSPRERRRRTPSRERGSPGPGGGNRRVSRSPGKRSEATNPSGSLVNSSNVKFVTVPATNHSGSLVNSSNKKFVTVTSTNHSGSLVNSSNIKFVTVDPSSKRVTTVKRSIGEACRTAAMSNFQPPPPPHSSSPYRRRKPLGEIDQNATKGDKKKMIKREDTKPQVVSRSRSLRKSRDFDLLQSSEEEKIPTTSSYTALLLKDIKKFNGKSNDDEEDPFSLLPSCVTKACSIVEAVADLNSSTSDLNQFRFTSTVTVKKENLMEPSFEKYVTVKRGCSLEEQESCG